MRTEFVEGLSQLFLNRGDFRTLSEASHKDLLIGSRYAENISDDFRNLRDTKNVSTVGIEFALR